MLFGMDLTPFDENNLKLYMGGIKMEKVKIFDVDILAGSREELFSATAELVGVGGAISTVNPEILYTSLENEDLKKALVTSVCIPDGIGVARTIRHKGVFSECFPGVELGEALLSVFSVRLGIIGGEEGVAERAMKNLSEKYTSVTPAFSICGYNINNDEIIDKIRTTKPDIVFVCLGSPKQEIFINEITHMFNDVLFVALGGSVDIYSGDKRRAPRFVRRLHAEWLYRMISEPIRVKRLPKLFLYTLKSRQKHAFGKKVGKIFKKGKKSI